MLLQTGSVKPEKTVRLPHNRIFVHKREEIGLVEIDAAVNKTPTVEHIAAQKNMRQRIRSSKRMRKLESAIQKASCSSIRNLAISLTRTNQIVLMGDGFPVAYLKPRKGLFWLEIIETLSSCPRLLKKGQTVSLPDLIRVINHIEKDLNE